jgi:hypothetical protein
MTLLLLLIMDYRFTGNEFHEIGGVALGLLLIFHNVLNWRWYGAFFKGRQSLRRVLITLVNLLLAVFMLTVFITGVLISVTVFAPLGLGSGSIFLHDFHQGVAYASLILAAIHLGLHWKMLMAKIKNWLHIDDSGFGWIIASRSISIAVIAYGIYASFVNHIGENLLMQYSFAGWGGEPSLFGFLLDYLAIGGCYVGITHYSLSVLSREKN